METAELTWAEITGRARLPSAHARVIAAANAIPATHPQERVDAYQQLREQKSYEHLDRLKLSASHIAELAVVVAGGRVGVNAARLDGNIRNYLARHALTTAHPASRFPQGDWRALLSATVAGKAVVLAAQGRPVTLTGEEAVPLAVVERAMRTTPERGLTGWPGTALTLRVLQAWKLVDYVRSDVPPSGEHWSGQLGKAVYRATPEGLAALARYRAAQDSSAAVVTGRTAEVLKLAARTRKGDLGVLDGGLKGALQKCLEARWLAEGKPLPGTTRPTYRVTVAGRAALEEWEFRVATERAAPPVPSFTMDELRPGQTIRVSNLQDHPGLSREWVELVEVRKADQSTPTQLARNYEVWVTSPGNPEPYLYSGRPLYRSVRFKVRTL